MCHLDSTPVFSLQVIPCEEFKEGWVLADPSHYDMGELLESCNVFLGGIDWTIDYL